MRVQTSKTFISHSKRDNLIVAGSDRGSRVLFAGRKYYSLVFFAGRRFFFRDA